MNRNARALTAGLVACAASGLVLGSACKKEESEEFGFTCIEFYQADSQEGDPFERTARIRVTLDYDMCLIDYYTKKHSEQQQTGVDGELVFQEWIDRLCTESVSDSLVPCKVESIEQMIVEAGASSVYKMSVVYTVDDWKQIVGRTLLWGPGPVEAFADCEEGQRPYAKLTAQSGIVGYDGDDIAIWQAQSWGDGLGIMQLNTAGCIRADIESL